MSIIGMFNLGCGLVGMLVCVMAFIRISVVDRAIGHRIEEVYKSSYWYEYQIDVEETYKKYMWDLRKWSYRSIFPEVVK